MVIQWQSKDMTSNNEFYTDLNGLEVLRRRFNVGIEGIEGEFEQEAPGNYYPINLGIFFED